jgi:hypothetical protein
MDMGHTKAPDGPAGGPGPGGPDDGRRPAPVVMQCDMLYWGCGPLGRRERSELRAAKPLAQQRGFNFPQPQLPKTFQSGWSWLV